MTAHRAPRRADKIADVRSGERLKALNSIAKYFSALERDEADSILGAARSQAFTPRDWDERTVSEKRAAVHTLLSWADDDLLEGLQELAASAQAGNVWADVSPKVSSASPLQKSSSFEGSIFVVHGHARAALHEAVRVLERGTGREVIVLHEQANAGRTILEKFEDHASSAAFAVVLLTGDDEGGVSSAGALRPRGRQNVIFELGFFFGKLGRHRVAVLLESGVEKPSDIDGLVYITIDVGGAWKMDLARELESAGIEVNRGRIP